MKSGNGNTRKGRYCPVLLKREKNRSGAVLLFIIITMIIMAVLGAAMVSIYSSSTVSQANPNQLRRAYYMAESGLRWVMGEVRTVHEDYQKDKLISYDGVSRNVSTDEGFSIKVYPYWLNFSSGGGTTATVDGAGLPEGVSFPTGTRISIGHEDTYTVSSANISSDRKSVTFSFQEAYNPEFNNSNDGFVVFKTTSSSQTITNGPGSSLTVALSNTDAIPKNNGSFRNGKNTYFYRKARVSGSNVILSDISWSGSSSETIDGGEELILTFNAEIESTGIYRSVRVVSGSGSGSGSGGLMDHSTSTKKSGYMKAGDAATGSALIMRETNEDLSGFDSADLSDVSVKRYIATGGTHPYWAAFSNVKSSYRFKDPQNPDFYIAIKTVRLNDNITKRLKNSWKTYSQLAYDYQIKCGWGKDLNAAAQGINVRWHETSPGSGLYEGYGLSYIAYEGITYKDCWWIICTNHNYDYIPNSLKPVDEEDHLWLVLWKQYVDGGVEKRKWLAYAELGDHGGRWKYYSYSSHGGGEPRSAMQAPKIVGNQLRPWGTFPRDVDGILNDNAGISVRVYDKRVYDASIPGIKRVTDIKAFVMDASTRTESVYQRISSGEANATNIKRKRYIPEWDAGGPALFPTWPSNLFMTVGGGGVNDKVIRYWDNYYAPNYEPDYYTLASTTPADTSKIRWIVRGSGETGMELVDDKATIRLSGGNQYILDSWENNRFELAVHVMGEITSGNRTAAFDDMAAQILGGVH